MIIAFSFFVLVAAFAFGRWSWNVERELEDMWAKITERINPSPDEEEPEPQSKAIIIDPDSIEYQVAMAKMEHEETLKKINSK